MQKPKHMRVKIPNKVKAIVTVNKALIASGDIPKVRGKQGFRTTPDLRNGYVFTNPSNLGRRSQFGMDGTKFGGGAGKLVINPSLRGKSVYK